MSTSDYAANPGGAVARPRVAGRARPIPRPRPELAALLALALVLNLWALSRNGWANEYYSAAVRAMSTSWHDFLYGSFDSSGVMTVDKPPLALWVQALSVRAFGFSSWSVLVPQALMGAASVGLLYDLTRRHFGRVAGFAGGLVLATTPMTVAVSRHNNPDALLVLCCVAAIWFLVRALEDGRTRWLVLSGVAVGLGFETKMAVALMVAPGIAAAWLWIAPRGRLAALRQLAAGGAAMAVVGLAWPVLVWLTPASERPWISGTSDNSIWSLIVGYNGLGRLDGQAGGPQAFGGGPGGGGGGGPFGGPAGPLRLLNESLGGQAGWLLGFAVVAAVALAAISRLRRTDARSGWLIAVGGSFAVTAVAFSFAQGIFHPYYVSLLAPFSAALVGAGAAELVAGGQRGRVLAALAVAGGVVTELVVLNRNPGSLTWLAPLLVLAGLVAVIVLGATDTRRIRAAALAVALGVLLIAPASWAVQTLGHATSATFPSGGPASTAFGGPGGAPPPGIRVAPGGGQLPPGIGAGAAGSPPAFPGAGGAPGGPGGGFGGPGGGTQSLTAALRYSAAHGGGTVAVSSQMGASSAILDTGSARVAALGGFSGRESQVSVGWLADAVRQGRVRWVLTDGANAGPGRDGRIGASRLMTAVSKACTKAPGTSYSLYDCSGSAAGLAAQGS